MVRFKRFKDLDPYAIGRRGVYTIIGLQGDATSEIMNQVPGEHFPRRSPGSVFEVFEAIGNLREFVAECFFTHCSLQPKKMFVHVADKAMRRHTAKIGDRQQSSLEAVLEVMNRIGDV